MKSKIRPRFGRNVSRPKVVVVGAGFAGINAVHELAGDDVDITIVDQNNFNTFSPLLYQVSTAYLPPEEISETVRSIFRSQSNVDVRVGKVTGVDWEARELQMPSGEPLKFDYLILATGATTNFFGIAGMKEHSWPLYTLGDAVALRSHLLNALEVAATTPDRSSGESTVVVVGGGPTGVEMAGALAAMGTEFIGKGVHLRVVLVEALPRLLNGFSERSSKQAIRDLEKRGVEIKLDTKVTSADDFGVDFANGERIETKTLIWAAGVQANSIGEDLGLQTGRAKAVVVDANLQVLEHPGVFAVGDGAVLAPSAGDPLPALAPVAIQSGRHAGRQVRRLIDGRQLRPFRYRDKGILAVIGKANAVAEIPTPIRTLKLKGFIAWLLWVGVHVVYLIGFRNRLKVLVSWGWSYFTSKGSGGVLIKPTRNG